MTKFKECRCGESIPAEWPECPSCLTAGIKGEGSTARRIRILQAKRRVGTQRRMEDVLRSGEGTKLRQQQEFLDRRAAKRREWARDAKYALRGWYEDDDE
jgi:hypothetical protein